MKVLAFAATNSRQSINKALVNYATTFLGQHDVEILDISDYELPLYSVDLEKSNGIPEPAKHFLNKITETDALLISFAEHNGNYTAAYKNLFDWASRINAKVFQAKPMVLLSTSPGPGGAKSVLSLAHNSAQYFDGHVLATLSIPRFYDNFDTESGELSNAELASELQTALATLATVNKRPEAYN